MIDDRIKHGEFGYNALIERANKIMELLVDLVDDIKDAEYNNIIGYWFKLIAIECPEITDKTYSEYSDEFGYSVSAKEVYLLGYEGLKEDLKLFQKCS